MQYSESFRNASSKEHQEFVQMFFRMVSQHGQPYFPVMKEGGKGDSRCFQLGIRPLGLVDYLFPGEAGPDP